MATARQIIDSNFPELSDKKAKLYAEILTPGLVLSSAHQKWFDRREANKFANDIEKGLSLFIEAYNSLPRYLARDAGFPERDKIWDIAYEILGTKPEMGDAFPDVIERTAYPKKLGALSNLKGLIQSEIHNIHTNQSLHDVPQKAALYQYCVEVWEQIKQKSAPVKPSDATAFANFVSDIILFCGKDWSIESVSKAYRGLW